MEIFINIPGFHDKVNFVDDNNVVLGYDLSQRCCEQAGWYISKKIENFDGDIKDYEHKDIDNGVLYNLRLGCYTFDVTYFNDETDFYGIPLVIFKLIPNPNITSDSDRLPPLYLHLYNCHNGYYSHGFNFFSGQSIKTGNI